MSDSNREMILENLKGVLENISITNGFNNNVSRVERRMLTADDPSITAFPVLMLLGGGEVYADLFGDRSTSNFRIKIRGYSKNEQDPEGYLNGIIKDVFKVLESTTYNSVYHKAYRPLSLDTDEGWISTSLNGVAMFEITIEIFFSFLRSDP